MRTNPRNALILVAVGLVALSFASASFASGVQTAYTWRVYTNGSGWGWVWSYTSEWYGAFHSVAVTVTDRSYGTTTYTNKCTGGYYGDSDECSVHVYIPNAEDLVTVAVITSGHTTTTCWAIYVPYSGWHSAGSC